MSSKNTFNPLFLTLAIVGLIFGLIASYLFVYTRGRNIQYQTTISKLTKEIVDYKKQIEDISSAGEAQIEEVSEYDEYDSSSEYDDYDYEDEYEVEEYTEEF